MVAFNWKQQQSTKIYVRKNMGETKNHLNIVAFHINIALNLQLSDDVLNLNLLLLILI